MPDQGTDSAAGVQLRYTVEVFPTTDMGFTTEGEWCIFIKDNKNPLGSAWTFSPTKEEADEKADMWRSKL